MISISSLLGREEFQINNQEALDFIQNKVVLVTGAGGSIGSEICRQLVVFSPKQIILFGRNEEGLFYLEKELKDKLNYLNSVVRTGSITDEDRVNTIFSEFKPNIVINSAALKHVPMCEQNVSETIYNNVYGNKVILDASINHNVENFTLISSDKAILPSSTMGKSKRICELYTKYKSDYQAKTNISIVRFGNVLGSSGSVVPIFEEQIKNGGPVKITHKGMTRFFMSIPEASRLVIQAITFNKRFGAYILDMGEQIKISDLANKMIENAGMSGKIDVIETGIRPGEKLVEELTYSQSLLKKTNHDKIFQTQDVICTDEKFNMINDLFYFRKDAPPEFLKSKLNNIIY